MYRMQNKKYGGYKRKVSFGGRMCRIIKDGKYAEKNP
jgi:hypothetical protein